MKGVSPMGVLMRLGQLIAGNIRRSSPEAQTEYIPTPTPVQKTYGTHGRLEIPYLHISVPLYDAFGGTEKQRVVDEPNSAAYFHLGVQDVIADHASQANFQNLNMARCGMVAIVDECGKETVYQLVQSQIGHIRISPLGNRLFDQNWRQVAEQNAGGLCIYTCMKQSANDVMDVRLTYWQPIGKRETDCEEKP